MIGEVAARPPCSNTGPPPRGGPINLRGGSAPRVARLRRTGRPARRLHPDGSRTLSPCEHPQSLYWFGMHGTVAENWAVLRQRTLICVGARFDDRITGKVDKFAGPDAKIIHTRYRPLRSIHKTNTRVDTPHSTRTSKYALKAPDRSSCNVDTASRSPTSPNWFETIKTAGKPSSPSPTTKANTSPSREAPGRSTLRGNQRDDAIITHRRRTRTKSARLSSSSSARPRTYISSVGLGTNWPLWLFPAHRCEKSHFPN